MVELQKCEVIDDVKDQYIRSGERGGFSQGIDDRWTLWSQNTLVAYARRICDGFFHHIYCTYFVALVIAARTELEGRLSTHPYFCN